jgi:hypothetical protein
MPIPVPQIGTVGGAPGGSSGGRSGGSRNGNMTFDNTGSGPSAASLGLALDLSKFTPSANFLEGFDPLASVGGTRAVMAPITVNVNGGLATSADIGAAVVDAIKQYTNVSGPADIAVA